MTVIIAMHKRTEWEEIRYGYLISNNTVNSNTIELIRGDLSERHMELVYAGPKPEEHINLKLDSMLIDGAKELTKQIINGTKQLPSLEMLPKSSRLICTIVHSYGQAIAICIPIHYYHVWRSLENNDIDDNLKLWTSTNGSIFVRLATESELNQSFITFERFGGVPMKTEYVDKINTMLVNTIYR